MGMSHSNSPPISPSSAAGGKAAAYPNHFSQPTSKVPSGWGGQIWNIPDLSPSLYLPKSIAGPLNCATLFQQKRCLLSSQHALLLLHGSRQAVHFPFQKGGVGGRLQIASSHLLGALQALGKQGEVIWRHSSFSFPLLPPAVLELPLSSLIKLKDNRHPQQSSRLARQGTEGLPFPRCCCTQHCKLHDKAGPAITTSCANYFTSVQY